MSVPLFDCHCDTASLLVSKNYSLLNNTGHIDLNRASKYRPYAQFFAIFNDMRSGIDAERAFETKLSAFFKEIESSSDYISLCKSGDEAKIAAENGKIAAFLSIEGAEQIGCSVEKLRYYHSLGLRAVNITWNYENELSGSCAENPKKGLSEKGRAFVKECCKIGVIPDVSHISERGFWDTIETSDKPVIASHSNSKKLCNHVRNLTDEQYLAIIKSGGVAGINLYTEFLGTNADIDTVFAHIEHFLSLGGEKNIAIGADFDGCDSLPKGINGIEDIHKIYERLLKANYSQILVDDIFYNNMFNLVSSL